MGARVQVRSPVACVTFFGVKSAVKFGLYFKRDDTVIMEKKNNFSYFVLLFKMSINLQFLKERWFSRYQEWSNRTRKVIGHSSAEWSSGMIPILCWRYWVRTLGGSQAFSKLTSAETQQMVNHMQRKAIGCLLLSFLC